MEKFVLPDAPTELSFAQLVPAADNTRKMVAPDALEFLQLINSIRTFGLLGTFPLVVKPRADGKYDIVDGNHRVRAIEILRVEDPDRWLQVLFSVRVV